MARWEVLDSYGIVVHESRTLTGCGVWIDPTFGVDFTGRGWGKHLECRLCGFGAPDYEPDKSETHLPRPTKVGQDCPTECGASGSIVSKGIDDDRWTRHDDGTYTVVVGGSVKNPSGGVFTIRRSR